MTRPSGRALLDALVASAVPPGSDGTALGSSCLRVESNDLRALKNRLCPCMVLLRTSLAATVSPRVVSARGELSYDVTQVSQHVLVDWSIPWPFSAAA